VQLVNSSYPFSNGFAVNVSSGAVVNAQVYIKDVVGGNAWFVVQFKDLVTNQLVPGPSGYNFVASTAGSGFQQYNINVTVPVSTNPIEMAMYVWNSSGVGNVYVDDMSYNLSAGSSTQQFFAYYKADIKETHDYYPFGQTMPGRNWQATDYRYGFNGKESDNEVKGQGNSLDFGARIFDPRIGRWLSTDPDYKLYPNNSPYHFGYNNPIYYKDLNGGVISGVTKEDFKIVYQSVIEIFSSAKLKREIFQVAENGTQFKHIDAKDFEAAIEGLDENAKALAKGYYEAINSSYEYQIKIVNNNTVFDEDFRNNVIQSETAKEGFNLQSGKDIANEEFNGGTGFENGTNKSLFIINQEYITNDSKIQKKESLSSEMLKRDLNSAITNAIFGEFFAKDNFILNKRSKEPRYNVDYFITKVQMENLALRLQNLSQTNGYPIFPVFTRAGLSAIPVELRTDSPSKSKPQKGSGTHGNDRDLSDGIPNK
jgi:RHS repeat-associated protein